jgi:dihydroorotate dehydrogenase
MMRLLQLLPPEAAHGAALWALKHGLEPKAPPDPPALAVSLFGKTLSNPVGLAAGAEKRAEALTGWARMGFGLIEAGTVTPEARPGNPKPRVWRLGQGHLVNWMGLPGEGLEPFVKNIARFQQAPERAKVALGVSMAAPGGTPDDFSRMTAACAPFVDYFTLNASCPNVAGHGAEEEDARAQVKAAVAGAGGKPVLLKLGPSGDMEALKRMIDAAMESGAHGIVTTNTVPFVRRALLPAPPPAWPKRGGEEVGGYSGPLLLDTTLKMVAAARAHLGKNVPLIGVGGVQSGQDAARVMQAGANAVQLYTGLVYKGPGLLKEIKAAL